MKLRAHTSVVGTITASLALALAGPAIAANAAAETSSGISGAALIRFPEFAGLQDSRSLKDPLMLQGKLTDLSGKALAGAQVLLAAWPSNETVSKLPVGGSFSVVPVARTVAGKDGAYQLRSLITPLLMSLSGKDGLDVELDVFHGGRHYVYLTQLSSEGNGSWVHDFVRGVDGQAGEQVSTATNALDLALDPATGEALGKNLTRGAQLRLSDKPIPGGPGCTHYEKVGDKEAWTTLARAIARNGTTINTTYSKGAKTAASTGFSFDKGVSFAVSGARTHSASVDAKFFPEPSKRGGMTARSYEALITHAVFSRVCNGDKFGEYRTHHMTTPTGLKGGFRNIPDTKFAPVPCLRKNTTEATGVQKIATENAKAHTYERAFGFAPVPGGHFSGHALSGYSEQVRVEFKFATRSGYWCGDSATPLEPGQMVQGYER